MHFLTLIDPESFLLVVIDDVLVTERSGRFINSGLKQLYLDKVDKYLYRIYPGAPF
jgi:hypothetical protein